MGFRNEPKERTIAIEAPGASEFYDLDPRLIVPVEQFICDFAIRGLVSKFNCG
jgi:hypothetical protein